MRGRHTLILGFGLGGLAVIGLIAVAESGMLRPQGKPTAAKTAESSATPPATAGATPTAAPALGSMLPAVGGAMVYDPENHGILLFGGTIVIPQPDGTNPVETLADTWLWDGKSWKKMDVAGPPARSVEMMAYDSVRHEIVMFGGSGPSGAGQALLFQDTWTWDGSAWLEQHPAHAPKPRARAAIAFDERRGVTVMFGGEGEGTITYNATWTWNGIDWTLQDPVTVPPGRHFATMAYDIDRGVSVLFGGSMAGARFNDTWTWDGSNWTQQGAVPPAARGWSDLAYDAATHRVVAYVYLALENNPVREYTITWDGHSWNDVTSARDPSPRAETRMAYDPETQQVLLYGGSYLNPTPYDETWTWDGKNWTLWQPAGAA